MRFIFPEAIREIRFDRASGKDETGRFSQGRQLGTPDAREIGPDGSNERPTGDLRLARVHSLLGANPQRRLGGTA